MDTAAFLETLYGHIDQGCIEVTYIAGREKLYPRTIVQWAPLPLVIRDPEFPVIRDLNERGYSVYFGTGVRKAPVEPTQEISEKTGRPYTKYHRGKKEHTACITAMWIDIDSTDKAVLNRALCSISGLPSIIINSGGGFHAYWRLIEPVYLDEVNRLEIEWTLKGMAVLAQADTAVAEVARIMRLPGFMNKKEGRNNAMCQVIDALPISYHFEQLRDAFMKYGRPREARVTREVPDIARNYNELPEWALNYLKYGAPMGGRNKRLFAVAKEYQSLGRPMLQAMNELGQRGRDDGLSQEEIDRTIQSAYEKAPTNPHDGLEPRMRAKMAAADSIIAQRGRLGNT